MHQPHQFQYARSNSSNLLLADPFGVAELASFDEMISGDSEDERIRKRILYLKNASRKIVDAQKSAKNVRLIFILFALIPLFWPIIFLHDRNTKDQKLAFEEQIKLALEYWQLDSSDIA